MRYDFRRYFAADFHAAFADVYGHAIFAIDAFILIAAMILRRCCFCCYAAYAATYAFSFDGLYAAYAIMFFRLMMLRRRFS